MTNFLHLKLEGRISIGEKLADLQKVSTGAVSSIQPRIILDFAGVSYIDSSGLGEVLKLFLECRQKGKTMIIVNIPPTVAKVLHSSKLDKVFIILPTLEEAIALES